jgi:hypothetical protein
MKNSGFKMKGYTYPGTSPIRGKAQMKRDAARAKADAAQDAMSEAFENQFKSTTKSLSPMVQKSPFKIPVAPLIDVAKESFMQTIGKKAAEAAVTTGISALGGALTKDKKKERRQTDTATMNQNFGSTNIA